MVRETAYLSKPDAFISLKYTLDRALNDKMANKIGEQARAEMFKKYTWKRRAQEILNAIGVEN